MKIQLLLLATTCGCLWAITSNAQINVSFLKAGTTFTRPSADSTIFIPIVKRGGSGSFRVKAYLESSTLYSGAFSIVNFSQSLDSLRANDSTTYGARLTVRSNSADTSSGTLTLRITVVDSAQQVTADNRQAITTHTININRIPQPRITIPYSFRFAKTQKIQRTRNSQSVSIPIAATLGSYAGDSTYELKVVVDRLNTNLLAREFKIDFYPRKFPQLDPLDSSNNNVYVELSGDSSSLEDKQLTLKFEVYKNGILVPDTAHKLTPSEFRIAKVVNDTLRGFRYLAYVGTNFDLVDGTKAKNLFFATNVFLPPLKKYSMGMYLSLYGNRTMSRIDSLNFQERLTARRDDTSYYSFVRQGAVKTTTVSDNLGAYVNGLIKLGGASNPSNLIQLYLSPSMEFVWRRIEQTGEISRTLYKDTLIVRGPSDQLPRDQVTKLQTNQFAFNIGFAGFTLVHESKDICMRLFMTAGYSSLYYPGAGKKVNADGTTDSFDLLGAAYEKKWDMFFSGKLWITEAVTGITLQAEVTNNLRDPRPYYGVTLSKAFNFQNIGKIFQPIIARP
jgi:hypothetical protein